MSAPPNYRFEPRRDESSDDELVRLPLRPAPRPRCRRSGVRARAPSRPRVAKNPSHIVRHETCRSSAATRVRSLCVRHDRRPNAARPVAEETRGQQKASRERSAARCGAKPGVPPRAQNQALALVRSSPGPFGTRLKAEALRVGHSRGRDRGCPDQRAPLSGRRAIRTPRALRANPHPPPHLPPGQSRSSARRPRRSSDPADARASTLSRRSNYGQAFVDPEEVGHERLLEVGRETIVERAAGLAVPRVPRTRASGAARWPVRARPLDERTLGHAVVARLVMLEPEVLDRVRQRDEEQC
jgi:hypothetical protein